MFSPAARLKSAIGGFIFPDKRRRADVLASAARSWVDKTAVERGRDPDVGAEILGHDKPGAAELGDLAKLPPFKPVVIRLLRSFDREDVSTAEIASLVESDPVLTSEVLALVNSPLYGFESKVTVPARALLLLGMARSKSLVASLAMRAMMATAPKTPVMRRFWRHSAASAAVALELAPLYGVAGDLAHTAAIMHDLGRIGLLSAHTEPYTVLALRAFETVGEIVAAEEAEFGMNHCQAGLLLARAWELPKVFHETVAEHHGLPTGRDLLSLVQLSCRVADDFMFQAILHRGQCHPRDTIESYAPEEMREALVDRLANAEARVIQTIQSLDF
jgi:putative nucleotidyltransferase with HDIG domain